MARILWALTRKIMELHEDIWDMCEFPQMNKKSESTRQPWWCVARMKELQKDDASHQSLKIVCFQLRETTHDEKLEGQGTN
jgi:hypothetical protein